MSIANRLTRLFLLFWLVIGSAHAALVSVDSPFGAGTLTRDTSTNLEWLDLSVSRNMSTAEVAAALAPGGTFAGFRYARLDELCNLVTPYFGKAACGEVFGFNPLDFGKAQTFVNLFGPTLGSGNSLVGLLNPDPVNDQIFGAAFFTRPGLLEADADLQALNFPRAAFPNEGSWLIREAAAVPEPSALLLVGLALLGMVAAGRNRNMNVRG